MFDADRPIIKSDQDRLGRRTFAKYLARCILNHQNPESLVIGLYGGWGVGKTSVINLMLEELRFAASNMFDDEKPIILNFSPWSYSGQNQLIYSFFRRLSSELRNATYLENADKIIYLLELYVSFFTHQPVPQSLRPKHNLITQLFRRKMMTYEKLGWESGRDLTLVKAELNEYLGKQKHKIIIIIDNISRLEASEIKQIFQIVKSMGDYFNTVYILALDKEQLLRTLNHNHNGAEYLEKIVQLPFEIPQISQQDLDLILIERLKKLFVVIPEGTWNADYWADLYYATIHYFFETVRDITHYINTLSFGYLQVKELVNPVDFFAITALEVFEPQVYFGIRDNKDLFTDLMEGVYRLDKEKIEEDKARCDEILARAKRTPPEILLPCIIRLFPRLLQLYETQISFYHSEDLARKNKRICIPEMFEIYFRLSLPTGVIPEQEMNAILAMVKDEEGFALTLLRLNQDDRIIKFLDLLDSTGVSKIPNQYIKNAVTALIDSADLFPEGENSPFNFNTPMKVHRILHQLLRRFATNQERFQIYRDAITQAINSLYIIVNELRLQEFEHIETQDSYLPLAERDVSSEELQILKNLAVSKIIYWAEIGRLIEHPKLLPILTAWKNWGEAKECSRYVEKVTQEERGLLAFLRAALKEPIEQAISKLEKNSDWESSLINIENFIPVKTIEPQAKLIFENDAFEKLSERDQLAILIFLDLIHADTTKIIPKTSA